MLCHGMQQNWTKDIKIIAICVPVTGNSQTNISEANDVDQDKIAPQY